MLELFWAAVAPVNLPYSVLLVLVVGYWLLYVLGFLGSEALDSLDIDLDVDADADTDVDVDAEVDTDVDTGGWTGSLVAMLKFFYVGSVPLLIIFSIIIVSMWTLSVAANYLLGNSNGWIALALFFPNFVLSLIITKTVLTPFVPLLEQVFDQSSDKVEILGKTCTVTSVEATPRYGQAELTTGGAPILLNVVTREGVTLKKGEEAVVFDHDKTKNVYLIAALHLEQKPDSEE